MCRLNFIPWAPKNNPKVISWRGILFALMVQPAARVMFYSSSFYRMSDHSITCLLAWLWADQIRHLQLNPHCIHMLYCSEWTLWIYHLIFRLLAVRYIDMQFCKSSCTWFTYYKYTEEIKYAYTVPSRVTWSQKSCNSEQLQPFDDMVILVTQMLKEARVMTSIRTRRNSIVDAVVETLATSMRCFLVLLSSLQ
jgi:hypothetical protein